MCIKFWIIIIFVFCEYTCYCHRYYHLLIGFTNYYRCLLIIIAPLNRQGLPYFDNMMSNNFIENKFIKEFDWFPFNYPISPDLIEINFETLETDPGTGLKFYVEPHTEVTYFIDPIINKQYLVHPITGEKCYSKITKYVCKQ